MRSLSTLLIIALIFATVVTCAHAVCYVADVYRGDAKFKLSSTFCICALLYVLYVVTVELLIIRGSL